MCFENSVSLFPGIFLLFSPYLGKEQESVHTNYKNPSSLEKVVTIGTRKSNNKRSFSSYVDREICECRLFHVFVTRLRLSYRWMYRRTRDCLVPQMANHSSRRFGDSRKFDQDSYTYSWQIKIERNSSGKTEQLCFPRVFAWGPLLKISPFVKQLQFFCFLFYGFVLSHKPPKAQCH